MCNMTLVNYLAVTKRKANLDTKMYENVAGFDSRSQDFFLIEMNLIINVETPFFIIIIFLFLEGINTHTMYN